MIYLPVLFHVANNISYCLQNILKALLFIRAVRESPSVGFAWIEKRIRCHTVV
ncbi:glycosyltransferase domain protein [Rickettsia rhipicephali str. Ect]|uniref:Glycosyltransferase domain protein n=1 Tax=Rickettsia rhipicephali str. Ect TaxID=1359199 RepID=A0A0F3PG27_RICRH|nr:glycosyltransferase domain protein [Rickettsia rhipicephali str. Ect]